MKKFRIAVCYYIWLKFVNFILIFKDNSNIICENFIYVINSKMINKCCCDFVFYFIMVWVSRSYRKDKIIVIFNFKLGFFFLKF